MKKYKSINPLWLLSSTENLVWMFKHTKQDFTDKSKSLKFYQQPQEASVFITPHNIKVLLRRIQCTDNFYLMVVLK